MTDKATAEEALRIGYALFAEGRMEEAVVHLQRAIEADPELWAAHAHLGTAYRHLEKYEEAVFHLEQAIQAGLDDQPNLVSLGLAYCHLKDWDKAVDTLQRAHHPGEEPPGPGVQADLGRALMYQGNVKEGLRHIDQVVARLNHVLRQEPLDPVLVGLFAVDIAYAARTCQQVGEYTEAARLFERVLQIPTVSEDVQNAQDMARQGLRDIHEGQGKMTVDLESATPKAQAHAERGAELFFEEKYQDAAGELLLAIQASPEPFIEAERLLAHAYRISIETPEQLARTIEQYEKVVSLDPSDVGSWCWLTLLAQAASLTQQQVADATRQAWMQSGDTGTLGAIGQISRDSRIRRQAKKFRQIASRASVQAWQGFAGLDPEQDPGDKVFYALEAAVTLADFYREEAAAPSTARDWYKMASRVQVDALRDLSEEEVVQARELQATAERRHALLAEELKQAAERAKRKSTTTLAVIAVAVGLFLLACFICSGGFGLFD